MATRIRSTVAALAALVPAALVAQQGDSAATKDTLVKAAPTEASTANPVDFSGVAFGNFQYQGAQANKGMNKFELDRSYLTFRMKAGDRADVRVTADIYRPGAGAGLTLRAKYAYLNYALFQGESFNVAARGGVIQTPVIDQIENFWPRYLAPVAADRYGYMSSADLGVASLVSLPNKLGELYLGVLNGPGYTTAETDRFKDYTARLTLTPLSGAEGLLKSFAIIGYYYAGNTASAFVNGGAGQVGPVAEGLKRDRWGIFAGLRDPRLSVGVDYNQRKDEGETGANTTLSPRAVFDSTGTVFSTFATAKPFQWLGSSSLPLGLVGRFDRVKPNKDVDAYSNYVVAGLTWDLTKRVQVALDYQEDTPHNGLATTPSKTYFFHWVANF